MRIKKLTYCLLLTLLSISAKQLHAADYYQLSDQVFIDYLKIVNSDLINENDELVLAQVSSANLQTLVLPNSGLTNVDGLQFFTNIHTIDLSNNALEEMPDLTDLVQLKDINISYNKLTSFDVIAQLKSVEVLNLSNNLISTFPVFDENIALTDLNLSNNKLKEIVTFQKANALRYFDISFNWIENLQAFDALSFPVLVELNIQSNRLYFDDYIDLPSTAINKETQRAIVLNVPDTLYLGDTLKLDLSYDNHASNFHVLFSQPEGFELADSYTTLLSWPITDTSQGGVYFIQTSNSTYTSHVFLTNEFSFVVVEKPDEEPEEPPVEEPDPPIEEPAPPVVEPEEKVETDIDHHIELIPNGNPDERTIYLDGDGEAVVFNKTGSVYRRFPLPYEWDGSNTNGNIIPGYYLIKLDENRIVRITVVD